MSRVVLGGMSANLCVESHMRELAEQGFEVFVVRDATAGARLPFGDGYESALVNYEYISSGTFTTAEAVELFKNAQSARSLTMKPITADS